MKILILKACGVYKKGDVVDMEQKRGEQYIFASLGEEYKETKKAEKPKVVKKVEKKPAKAKE